VFELAIVAQTTTATKQLYALWLNGTPRASGLQGCARVRLSTRSRRWRRKLDHVIEADFRVV